jgi:hypothetical protein
MTKNEISSNDAMFRSEIVLTVETVIARLCMYLSAEGNPCHELIGFETCSSA